MLKRAFETQLSLVEPWLASGLGFTMPPVAYHDVMRGPLAVATAVNASLVLALDTAAMAGAVDPSLHHEQSEAP